jgi:hypothetical protein
VRRIVKFYVVVRSTTTEKGRVELLFMVGSHEDDAAFLRAHSI